VSNWYECRLVVAIDDEDPATAALFDLGTTGIRCDVEAGDAVLYACFDGLPSEAGIRNACSEYGVSPTAIAVRSLADEDVDWSENWKLHFSPRAVGERFYVCPPWAPDAPSGRLALVINPAMAFGTGQHATTRGCMILLERACAAARIDVAADLGTGSGILAIALAKLGVPRVIAVDNDPQARESTAENAQLNGVQGAVEIGADIADIQGLVDLFVANLFADLLVQLAAGIVARCSPEATIVCSGMLEHDGPRVVARFAELGWTPRSTQIESPWFSVALQQRKP
jgi:ribosomal protein L11 methyltransferase